MRQIAARLFSQVESLPIVSPHGHTDPAWLASNAPFEDAVSLLLWPDHYLLRMGCAENAAEMGLLVASRVVARAGAIIPVSASHPVRA